MRIGFMTDCSVERLDWAQANGFGSVQWNRFDASLAATAADWKPHALELASTVEARGLRISAIGALYNNPLDPRQSESAKSTFLRAIDVASLLGIKTVSGFAGAVIEVVNNPRGDNPVYKPFEPFLPRLLEFWEPIARIAADKGVRLAFEHCPMARYHLPVMGFNMLAQPFMWERLFNETRCENIGLEWDPSHLICQLIDPIGNLLKFGSRVFHVHAKDAYINRDLLAIYGICHEGVAEHRMPGFGQSDWAQIIHTLLRVGYDSDLNIEGWHDPVYRDHTAHTREGKPDPMNGQKLEDAGLLVAKQTLERFVPKEN